MCIMNCFCAHDAGLQPFDGWHKQLQLVRPAGAERVGLQAHLGERPSRPQSQPEGRVQLLSQHR